MTTKAPTHRPPGWIERKPWNRSASSHARGYGSNWRKLRAIVLATEPLCRVCRSVGRTTPASEVDHVIPKTDGGRDERENLQAICHDCHVDKSAREGSAASRRG